MDFGWLKRIFKKKNLSNVNTSDLATIDTSFIRVPKLSKLSKEEKEKVLDFYNKLISDDDINLVKYSNDLLEKANTEREMLLRAMSRYEEQYRFLEEKYKKEQQVPSIEIYHLGKLSSLEYSIIEKKIINIRRELELKLVALDMYIKKEEKRKYDFLGIFSKAERIRYLTDKNKLLSERERLLTSIKIDENILTIIRKDIRDNQRLTLFYELLNELQKDDDTTLLRNCIDQSLYRFSQKSLYTFKEEFEDEVETEVGYKMEGYSIPIKEYEYVCGEQNHLYAIFRETNGIINEELIKYIFETVRISEKDLSGEFIKIKGISKWKDFISVVPDEFLDKIYEIVAKYSHKRDLYVYEHRNDYKEYLQDIKGLIDKCELTSIDEWDSDILREKVKNYTQIIKKYLNIYGNDRSSCFSEPYDEKISPPMEEQLKKNYFKLLFLYTISNGYDDSIFEIFSHSYYSDRATLNIVQIYDEFSNLLNELLIDVYNKYKVMPNFDTKCYDKKELINKIKNIVGDADFLYRVLNGNYDDTELYVSDRGLDYTPNDYGSKLLAVCLNDGISKKSIKIYNIYENKTISIEDKPISIEDLYYIFNIAGIDKTKLFEQIDKNSSITKAYIDLLAKIKWNKIDNENDDRIFVIPKQVKIHEGEVFTSLKYLDLNDNNIAIYATTNEQIHELYWTICSEPSTNIKYLMMPKSCFNKLKDALYNHLRDYLIIIVPDDVKYCELSKYLDQELEKEQEQPKVLSKTR